MPGPKLAAPTEARPPGLAPSRRWQPEPPSRGPEPGRPAAREPEQEAAQEVALPRQAEPAPAAVAVAVAVAWAVMPGEAPLRPSPAAQAVHCPELRLRPRRQDSTDRSTGRRPSPTASRRARRTPRRIAGSFARPTNGSRGTGWTWASGSCGHGSCLSGDVDFDDRRGGTSPRQASLQRSARSTSPCEPGRGTGEGEAKGIITSLGIWRRLLRSRPGKRGWRGPRPGRWSGRRCWVERGSRRIARRPRRSL